MITRKYGVFDVLIIVWIIVLFILTYLSIKKTNYKGGKKNDKRKRNNNVKVT